MMKNISEQKVTVLCDFSPSMNGTILHGIFIAGFLKKELCLFSLAGGKGTGKAELSEKLREIALAIQSKNSQMDISCLVLKGTLEENTERLADKYDSVILIMNKVQLRTKLKALKESTVPFLFIDGKVTDLISYKQVVLPVDYRKEMKETSLWASYLGRFNNAGVIITGAREQDQGNREKVRKNLLFIRKFLKKLQVGHIIQEGRSNSWKIQFEALKNAHGGKGDILIILGSKYITLLDLLIGLPEKKIIQKAGPLPVLCINPSKDMNILCD
jgi:hypothetical protein